MASAPCLLSVSCPTPPEVVQQMIARAAIRAELPINDEPPLKILEPSAGSGNIADALRDMFGDKVDVTCIELNYDLQQLLTLKGYTTHGADFIEWKTTERYSRILMNPPFEKWEGEGWQDITHVRKAYSLLRAGGAVVSVMSQGSLTRDDKQSREFVQWLDRIGGYYELLPEGSFKASGTNVATAIVVIWKPDK